MNVLKIAFVVVPLLVPLQWYVLRFAQIESLPNRIVYAGLFGACLLATTVAAFTRAPALRLLYAAMFAGGLALTYAYQAIVVDFLTYDVFVGLWRSRAFIGDALAQFFPSLLPSALAGAVLFAGIAIPPRLPLRAPSLDTAATVLPATVVLGVGAMLYARGGDAAIGLPGNIAVVSYSLLYAVERARAEQNERAPVTLTHDATPMEYDVVLIVDESIRGDYLDVGGASGVASGLLDGNPAVHSYGRAASATNCGEPSNAILRYGGTRESYRQAIDTQPSIFHYAKERGLATVYIDGQRTGRRLHNGMDAYELTAIDEFVQLDGIEVVQRDRRIADMLVERTNNDLAEFILVNKVGAPFPVHDKYPDEYLRYEPALERGRYWPVSDTGERSTDRAWERYTNSYRNTLLWSVGEFFRVVLSGADLGRAFVVYTSDHGQDFGEANAGFNLHCSPNPSPYEGLVPLVVITDVPTWSQAATLWAERNHDAVSHYMVFPALLRVLGYADADVRTRYGASLLEETNDPMTFNYRAHARLGVQPQWRQVPATPP